MQKGKIMKKKVVRLLSFIQENLTNDAFFYLFWWLKQSTNQSNENQAENTNKAFAFYSHGYCNSLCSLNGLHEH